MNALLIRDLKLAFRRRTIWLSGVIFFWLFLTLCAIAMGGNMTRLAPMAPALIWLAAIFSQLLGFNQIFQNDIADGSFEQLHLSGLSPLSLASSKMLACFIVSFLPIILATPIAALAFQLPSTTIAGTMLTLLIGAPALISYGTLSGALMAGQKSGAVITILISAPFLIPVLIFAISAIDSYPLHGLISPQYQALAALSVIAISAGLPATAAALSTYLD